VEYYAAYEGEKLNMRVWFTNNGTNYENELFLWIDKEEKMRTGVGAYVDPGKSDYIDFRTEAPAKGTHDDRICTDWDGKKVIYTGKLTVTDAPEYNLEAKINTRGLNNNVVLNNLDVECIITNKGTTTFNNVIDVTTLVNEIDEHGNQIYRPETGYPTWKWQRVWYLSLKPNETGTVSFSMGSEVLIPKYYQYDLRIFYYNNNHEGEQSTLRWLYNTIFTYKNDGSGINPTILQNPDDDIYYDLQGRRVNANDLKRGVYIHKNKKILVK
jgi:hypothetical protein